MTIQEISELMDAKLAPIKNKLDSMETDLKAIKTHVESINTRLFKIEERMADSESTFSRHYIKFHAEQQQKAN